MSSGSTANYSLSYPLSTDPVNVASDIQSLAQGIDTFLTNPALINNINIDGGSIITSALTANIFNTNATTLNVGGTATTINIGNASGQTNFAGNVNVATGKSYKINNVDILTSTALASSVVSSSLTSVGTIGTGVWQASTIAVAHGGTGATTSTGTGSVVLSDSPALTGTPTSTTPPELDNSTKIATTAYVVAAVAEGGSGTIVYQDDAPTEDLKNGTLWVDKNGEAEMLNANDYYTSVAIDTILSDDYYTKTQLDEILSGAGVNPFFLMGA
jgi:hypothetical protein